MLNSFVELIFNVYEAYTAALFLSDGEYLRCTASTTFAKSFDREKAIPVEGTLAGWVVKHNEALIIPNFDKDETVLGYYREREEIKSFMGYPVEVPPGVIVVDSKKSYVFTDSQKKILAHFVRLIGQEVTRERRVQELEEKNEELMVEKRVLSLFRALGPGRVSIDDILAECLHVAGADLCYLAMEKGKGMVVVGAAGMSADSVRGMACPGTGTIASMVVEGGRELLLPFNSGFVREKAMLAPDDSLRGRQFFGFPLVAEEVAFGVLGFVSLSERSLRESSINMLKDAAFLFSLHLAYEWVKQGLKRTRDVEPVTHALLFPAFCREVGAIMGRGERLSLISVRIVDLAGYNESAGLEQGDALLRRVFLSMEYCLGKNVPITRSGGGRFLAAVAGVGDGEVANMVKILSYTIFGGLSDEQALAKNRIRIGVSRYPEEGESMWELFDQAERRGG